LVFGELGLDGRLKSSSTLFPIVLSLKEQGVLKKAPCSKGGDEIPIIHKWDRVYSRR